MIVREVHATVHHRHDRVPKQGLILHVHDDACDDWMLQFVDRALNHARIMIGEHIAQHLARPRVHDDVTAGIRDKQLLLREPTQLRFREQRFENLQN